MTPEEQEDIIECDRPLRANPSDHRDWAVGAPLSPRGKEREHVRTSVPDPGRKFLTTMVLPRAGKGASMTLLMRGCTSAGEMPRRFSTSSKICEDRRQLSPPEVRAPSSVPDEGGLPRRRKDYGEAPASRMRPNLQSLPLFVSLPRFSSPLRSLPLPCDFVVLPLKR